MFHRISILVVLSLLMGISTWATFYGTIRGVVHDPKHRPIADAEVVLKAKGSDYARTAHTDPSGEFIFDAVPLGDYSITVSKEGFATMEQSTTVLSGTAPIFHLELPIAEKKETITVSAAPAQTETTTTTTNVNLQEIEHAPGGTLSNSLAMITNYTPGSYYTHDQLHIRGGHQVSWLIDGVPIPNTAIASNIGPQINPKDIDDLEVLRGSYTADYGDRTYGVFSLAPKNGFERNNEAELLLSAGNFAQTDNQFNLGGHTDRLGYYLSANGNSSEVGLQPPTAAVIHDGVNGYGGFGSLIYNLDSQNQFRLVGQARRDFYEVPYAPDDPVSAGLRDTNTETDAFAAFTWTHTFNPGLLLTVSPFYHYNRADYESSPTDLPASATEKRGSHYEGGQAVISWVEKRSNFRGGIYGFAQQDNQLFSLIYNDGSSPSLNPIKVYPSGGTVAIYGEEQFRATSWLTFDAGVRQTHFSGGAVENVTSPRFGVSIRVPKLNWVFRGTYGQFYQAPPLVTISGPLLDLANNQNLGFIPLHGERDEEAQVGVTIPFRGWSIDADTFRNHVKNFFDHNNLNNSNIFFPITIQGARVNAWELTLRSPRIYNRGQVYVTYSNQVALGCGDISGGLTNFSFGRGCGYLDHDQRNTLHVGGNVSLPWRTFASTDVYYGSGFSNGNPPPSHLSGHTTFDLVFGKDFGERFAVSVTALNVANRRILLDNSYTFGGTHYNLPRQIYAQVRYRFHY
jgi:outer membrane cobalamin receptor